MPDVFKPGKRSEVMSRIKGRGNAATEMAMVAIFREAGITGWRRHVELRPMLAQDDKSHPTKNGRIRVRPDFIFRSVRLAVFIDGCFWHGCSLHAKKPRQNFEFWSLKLQTNIQRDLVQNRALAGSGWTVLRIWEHELKNSADIRARFEEFMRKA